MLGLGSGIITASRDLFVNQYSLSFDGSNDKVDTGQTFQSTFRSNFSIGFWIKPDDGQPDANDYAIGGIESGNTDSFIMQIGTNGKLTIAFKANEDILSIRSDAAVFADGEATSWKHILIAVADADPTTITVYTDGTEEACSILSSQELSRTNHQAYTCNDNIWIGAANNNGTGSKFFAGDIDEFAVWGTALSAAQAAVVGGSVIDLNIEAGDYTGGARSLLVQYLRFDEGTGTTAIDEKGTQNGTIDGASYVAGGP